MSIFGNNLTGICFCFANESIFLSVDNSHSQNILLYTKNEIIIVRCVKTEG